MPKLAWEQAQVMENREACKKAELENLKNAVKAAKKCIGEIQRSRRFQSAVPDLLGIGAAIGLCHIGLDLS